MCGMTQYWVAVKSLAVQLALNSASLLRKGLLGCRIAAGQHWYCLLLREDASIWIVCHLWHTALEGTGVLYEECG